MTTQPTPPTPASTPRTDRASFLVSVPTPYDPQSTECVTAYHARQLERELAALRSQLAEAREEIAYCLKNRAESIDKAFKHGVRLADKFAATPSPVKPISGGEDEVRAVLVECRDALTELPEDCLGEASAQCGEGLLKWPIRDELIDRITKVLAAPLPGLSAVVDGGRDKERLDWLDAHTGYLEIKVGHEGTMRQHIDAAMSAASTDGRQGEKGV